tara:strand:+ start:30434 stop:31864 length:1431 start_codon:yes stop_codon:yes gene_type:complete
MSHTTCTQDLWETVKSDFQSLFPHDVYRTWFESMECIQQDDESITLGVPNDFAAIWIQDNYSDLIAKRFQMATGHSMAVEIKATGNDLARETTPTKVPSAQDALSGLETPTTRIPNLNTTAADDRFKKPKAQRHYLLNPKNTFENYVVGVGNQLAHAACIAVANAPGKAYNPLFLYGDTGLGKTHSMQAIAHHVLNTNPEAKIIYVSSEKFTNEYIRAIQENSVIKFRQKYRQADVLLIDDIHFLSGKERIQEEFFHTFNELFESGKQIVMSSDRPVNEIAKLENRLVSRFQWGLVTDIQAPDLETRMAILAKKAEAMNLELEEPIMEFLAERVSRNVRRMEGALTRVAGYAALTNGSIDIASVEKLLQDILQEEAQNKISIEKIQEKIAKYYKLTIEDMSSKRRPANIAFPRQIAMYLSRMLTSHSLQEIGNDFGGRDHGTVIHACKTVENMMEQDASIKHTVESLQNQLANQRF